MRTIRLHGALAVGASAIALVDDSDFEPLSKYRWWAFKQAKGQTVYAMAMTQRRNYRRQTLYMHRLVLGASDLQMVDHKNGNGLDNRRCNLRFCSHADNMRNTRRINSKSGFKGVRLDRRHGRWMARIKVDGQAQHLGCFATALEAAAAYDAAAIRRHGEFACTNATLLANTL